jgi:hypothetical protein
MKVPFDRDLPQGREIFDMIGACPSGDNGGPIPERNA